MLIEELYPKISLDTNRKRARERQRRKMWKILEQAYDMRVSLKKKKQINEKKKKKKRKKRPANEVIPQEVAAVH